MRQFLPTQSVIFVICLRFYVRRYKVFLIFFADEKIIPRAPGTYRKISNCKAMAVVSDLVQWCQDGSATSTVMPKYQSSHKRCIVAYRWNKTWVDSMSHCVSAASPNGWEGGLLTQIDQETWDFVSEAFDEPMDGVRDGNFYEGNHGLFIGGLGRQAQSKGYN